MFEHLKKYNSIIVSGPQRSGTRIAAKIIAHDTGKRFVDEKFIDFHDFGLLEWFVNDGNWVIQCPALCHKLHKLKSGLVVLVRRKITDIIGSEKRVWHEESKKAELSKYGYSKGRISKIKYDYWDTVQKQILGERGIEVKYNDLSEHELFISKEDRLNFEWNQTEL